MPPLPEIVYPILQTTMRLLIRRAEQRELWFQKRMRRADVSALADYSFRQAVAYANRMAEVSPAYRRKLNEAGVKLPITESREAWLSLPTLRKSDFQQDSDEWFNNTLRRDELQWSCTSGSTGEPYRFPVDAKTLRGEHISFELSLRALGWRPGFREGALKMEMPPAKGLTRLARRLTGTVPIGFSAVEFRKEHAAEVMSAFRDGNVKYLRGYSSALALLAQEAQQKGLSCQIPLVTTFGEGLSTAQQEVIEKVFHCQAYRDYGGSEAMHVGFECPARTGYHLDLSRFHVEVLDGERTVQPGETGEIVVAYIG
ncbi:hypothetical protein KJ815_14155 [bacterium]|nr:hypothetical protein [bacterium]